MLNCGILLTKRVKVVYQMKRIQGFICGFLAAIVLLISVPALAASIDVIFNPLNIVINGVTATNKGENYTLANGTEVPFSIVYKGTTYLPLRKLAELVGKELTLDSKTDTVYLNDPIVTYDPKEEFPEKEGKTMRENQYVTKAELARFLVQSFELTDDGTRYDFPDVEKENEYYTDICIAVQHGYMTTDTKGFFTPDHRLTRYAYMYTMLFRVFKVNFENFSPATENVVKDAYEYGTDALRMITAMLEMNLLPLYEDGTFRLYTDLVMDLTPNPDLKNYIQE